MADHYYDREDLARFPDIGKNSPDLAAKFFEWYGAVFADGALSAREKSIVALAVAHAVQCPYCIDAYSRDALEKGADLDQMTEAVHVAAAIRGGASLVHGVQMRGHATKLAMYVRSRVITCRPLFSPDGCRSRRPRFSTTRSVGFPSPASSTRPSRARGNGRSSQRRIEVLQINIGKLCNQTCRHCHVDAGPDRREVMTRETMTLCLEALEKTTIPTVDITGGAPELNPDFRWLVTECRARGRHVMDRCNLTVLELASQQDLAAFLADHQVEVVCSLPHYRAPNTDRQRGAGVYEKSIAALKRLNAVGYGNGSSGLRLVLVTNPVGAYLPGSQASLETEWKRELWRLHGDPIRCALLHHEHADQPVSRMADRFGESRSVHGAARRGVQSCRGQRPHVPQHVVGRMGRTALRLRLQSDA